MESKLDIEIISCTPFDDQRPGTAGLRKKVTVFRQPHYLESFVQSVFDTLALENGSALVIGGDGRFYNREAIQTIIAMAAANGFGTLIIGNVSYALANTARNCTPRGRYSFSIATSVGM